jgi:YggT family protein
VLLGALLGPGPARQVVSDVLYLAEIILLIVVVMSWFPLQPGGVPARIYRVLLRITEPVLAPIRRALPRTALDFSPLVAFIGIFVLQRILIG